MDNRYLLFLSILVHAILQPFTPKPLDSLPFTTTKTLICPGWETPIVPVSQPGMPVRDKRGCPFVPGLSTGTKGAASAHVAGAPFCPGWCYQPGQKVSFFSMFFFSQFFFYFNYTFAFQLNLCIGIQCV